MDASSKRLPNRIKEVCQKCPSVLNIAQGRAWACNIALARKNPLMGEAGVPFNAVQCPPNCTMLMETIVKGQEAAEEKRPMAKQETWTCPRCKTRRIIDDYAPIAICLNPDCETNKPQTQPPPPIPRIINMRVGDCGQCLFARWHVDNSSSNNDGCYRCSKKNDCRISPDHLDSRHPPIPAWCPLPHAE